jgi:hypothetical protein
MGLRRRRRGRAIVLSVAAGALLSITLIGSAAVPAGPVSSLLVETPGGRIVASVALPPDGAFTLRYRNSLYGTPAAEDFVVTDGAIHLVGLRAEQLAVLEEYYAISSPARRDPAGGDWWAEPAHRPVIQALQLAATDLGERTLHVSGATPVELWRLVDDGAPHLVLRAGR